MKQYIFASIAMFGTSALAQSVGSAVVVNECPYDVYLFNTPSSGGGFKEQDSIIPSGGSWSQVWTQLTNGNGWAIKLSKSTDISSVLQYEYTFHNDGNIWYDLSAVNGDPWGGNWNLIANGFNCTPRLAAYQYSTDDAHGMQDCAQEATISAILCGSGSPTSAGTTISATPSSSAAPAWSASETSISLPSVTVPSIAPASSSVAPVVSETPATSATSTPLFQHTGYPHHSGVQAAVVEPASTPTTFATSATVPVEEAPGVTVWEVETAVVTAVVTATYTAEPPSRIRRHEHHAHHQHSE